MISPGDRYADGFDRNPEDGDFATRYQIVRTPSEGMLKAIVLSVDLVGKLTHWNGNQTVPHTDPYCAACVGGSKMDWHGYVAVASFKSREVAIMEFTFAAKTAFEHYLRVHGSLRGALLLANRVSKKSNARIRISLEPSKELPIALPEAPDVKDFLRRMWKMSNGFTVYPPIVIPLTGSSTEPPKGRMHDIAELLNDPRRANKGE